VIKTSAFSFQALFCKLVDIRILVKYVWHSNSAALFELFVPRIFDTAFNEVSRIVEWYSITLVLAFTLLVGGGGGGGKKQTTHPSY
jgi:hypothetical protein